MAAIKLIEEPKEVYFKTTTHYKLEVDGNPITVCIEEDSNESNIHYYAKTDSIVPTYSWGASPPDWVFEMGENDWGELIFETLLRENIVNLQVGEEISTDEL